MGERLNDGGEPVRRRPHPAGTGPAADAVDQELEALLAHVLRIAGRPVAPPAGSEGELRAVAAFRAARDAGAHTARTRRRDDWRPRTRRSTARSLRATLSVAVASLALGGVAFAAIGSAGEDPAEARRPERSAPASEGRSAAPSLTPSPAAPSAPAERDRPVSAQDTAAHCRAYERVEGRGRALDSTAWQRLVTAAGGEENVEAYCAAQTAPARDAGGNDGGNTGKIDGESNGKNDGGGSGRSSGTTGKGQDKAAKNPEGNAGKR
ncbi:hypothetical protein [Streptomyces sp. DSM 15324]|uniref:hypothetical protein n=1 Tax=Streptomyces sp. DSM 15324 TaxID=1739111 RepID=UPI00074AC4F0|nr:hypothetical protein [Streptomyces sp. DSM 15324]KUO11962.1 hypothetical protein AQJ58_12490 [Streptomyces sp. DSM 15324]